MNDNNCPICSTPREPIFSGRILNKYHVTYFVCNACGLLQTETPYWLDEAYSNAISSADTGLVARNVSISKKLTLLLYFLLDKNEKYLDMAGGYGMLTRLMRDVGFDFYWSDPYCKNILARGFEGGGANSSFSAVTAFEVLEHVQDPVAFMSESLEMADTSTIIFSTELYKGDPPDVSDWWYYALSTGQHISFYQRRTLEMLANKLSLNLYSINNFHMLTANKVNKNLFHLLVSRFSNVFYVYAKKKMISRTFCDHEKLMKS